LLWNFGQRIARATVSPNKLQLFMIGSRLQGVVQFPGWGPILTSCPGGRDCPEPKADYERDFTPNQCRQKWNLSTLPPGATGLIAPAQYFRYGISLFVAGRWRSPPMQDYLDARGLGASQNDHRRFHNLDRVPRAPPILLDGQSMETG